jgi:hypothetical protein
MRPKRPGTRPPAALRRQRGKEAPLEAPGRPGAAASAADHRHQGNAGPRRATPDAPVADRCQLVEDLVAPPAAFLGDHASPAWAPPSLTASTTVRPARQAPHIRSVPGVRHDADVRPHIDPDRQSTSAGRHARSFPIGDPVPFPVDVPGRPGTFHDARPDRGPGEAAAERTLGGRRVRRPGVVRSFVRSSGERRVVRREGSEDEACVARQRRAHQSNLGPHPSGRRVAVRPLACGHATKRPPFSGPTVAPAGLRRASS